MSMYQAVDRRRSSYRPLAVQSRRPQAMDLGVGGR
jgi:hypothetical protein